MVSITRRGWLLASAATALVSVTGLRPALAADSVTLNQFLALSKRLTGASDLDPGIAKTLLDGLVATGKGPALSSLVADGGENGALANTIVGSWYSGIYDDGSGLAVATFNDALVWNALTFTKPFASCGGQTGYWSEPPQD